MAILQQNFDCSTITCSVPYGSLLYWYIYFSKRSEYFTTAAAALTTDLEERGLEGIRLSLTQTSWSNEASVRLLLSVRLTLTLTAVTQKMDGPGVFLLLRRHTCPADVS